MPWYEQGGNNRLWYQEQGKGPAIVLLHGWCMSSSIWRLQLETLSTTFRVIAPDLAGHGSSAPSRHGYRFEGFADDIVALFRHLDIRDALLAGWSLGAQVALQASARLRERLTGLVLISATPRFIATDDFPWGLSPVEGAGMALKLRRNAVRALEGFRTRLFAPGELDDPALAARVRDLLAAVPLPDATVALQSLNALVEADMRHLLPAIHQSTLIVGGDRDTICLPEASTFLAERIPSGQRVVMPGCGHAPFLTRSDEFDACINDFSRRVCGSSR